jgi:hypothetical protein
VTVPVRLVAAVFAATLSCTLPFPLPDAPAVTVIQELLLTAVHAHPVVPVTVTVYELALDVADTLVGEKL